MRNNKKSYKNFSARRVVSLVLLTLFVVMALSVGASAKSSGENEKLIVGGVPFGVKFNTQGVVVISTEEVITSRGAKTPAADAGLRAKDIIIEANGKGINSVSALSGICESSLGSPVNITYIRDGKEYKAKITPAYSKNESRYLLGMNVKDSGAGLGTVTYIIPDTLEFAGLGHGICDSESGKLVPMSRGLVTDVTVSGIKKGVAGAPGEIKGYFGSSKKGTLYKNTECGVYGMFTDMPEGVGEAMYIGKRNELHDGEAYIICTLDGSGPKKYSVEISNIDREATGSKCFTIKIKDKNLINLTGGIVQGMSGSPVIQDGKLVGAVTHVLINDPTTGYGIFIENMLRAA